MGPEAPRKPPSAGGRPLPGGDEPRLGIIHLIVGITCVAVYQGLQQTALNLCGPALDGEETGILFKGMLLFSGLGAGIALGGPCLLGARVVRGVPFPIHPGDHLLVLWGVNSVLVLGASFMDIISILIREFTKWIILANLLAWPIAFIILRQWLIEYAYYIDLRITTFLLAGLIVVAIALTTIFLQASRIAYSNPTENLRYE